MIRRDKERELRELKIAVGMIETYDGHFVAYNTKFLGYNYDDNYIIRGQSIKNSKSLNEFCFGYDGTYEQLHLLHVYETKSGLKYASIEISMGVYAFWEIID